MIYLKQFLGWLLSKFDESQQFSAVVLLGGMTQQVYQKNPLNSEIREALQEQVALENGLNKLKKKVI